jgi:hypothetical protein
MSGRELAAVSSDVMTDLDRAPAFPPRTILISWMDGEELEITPSPDFAEWEVAAALTKALDVWTGADSEVET